MSRILLVDDDEDIHMIIKAVIGSNPDYDVEYAHTGSEGLNLAEIDSPDLILLDYILPDYNGKKLMTEFGKNKDLDNVPIIFLTGNNDPSLTGDLIAAGAKGVISKPFTIDHLADEISKVLT